MSPARRPTRYQRGVAAVELALLLPILLMLLAIPLFFGRVFWHYTVAQKAAHDAARYLSSVPLVEMKSPTLAISAVAVAQAIAAAETAELNPGPYAAAIILQCDGIPCTGLIVPTTVKAIVQMQMYDGIFDSFTWMFTGDNGLLLKPEVTMRYVGN